MITNPMICVKLNLYYQIDTLAMALTAEISETQRTTNETKKEQPQYFLIS